MRWIQVDEDGVIQAVALEAPIVTVFQPDPSYQSIDDEVYAGWKKNKDGSFSPPEIIIAPVTNDDVDNERDRRIALGFSFGGARYQSRPNDLENIAGASTAAIGAIVTGAKPNDLRWHGGTSDFAWIAEDNTLTPMDAPTMFSFGLAAMLHKETHIRAARSLKDAIASGKKPDITDDKYWSA